MEISRERLDRGWFGSRRRVLVVRPGRDRACARAWRLAEIFALVAADRCRPFSAAEIFALVAAVGLRPFSAAEIFALVAADGAWPLCGFFRPRSFSAIFALVAADIA